jgi:hypothetical protein
MKCFDVCSLIAKPTLVHNEGLGVEEEYCSRGMERQREVVAPQWGL